MVKKLFAGWGLTCILLFFSISRVTPNTTGIESVIYRIEFRGEYVGCLVGTFHLTPKRPTESKQLSECSKEASIAAFESIAWLTLVEQLQLFDRKKTDLMFTDLSTATQARAILALKNIGLSEDHINILKQMHPGVILHFLIASKPISPDLSFEIGDDVSDLLYRQKNSLPLFELEGKDFVLSYVRELPLNALDNSIENLSIILSDEELSRKAKEEITRVYTSFPSKPDAQTGMNAITKIYTVILKLSPEYAYRFVNMRNQRLVDGMERAIKLHGRALIFVGLSHLGDPEGVPTLLEKKGYKLIRIQ